nr:MAG TPA: hypothetical protein [Caudoviricetes sp.]
MDPILVISPAKTYKSQRKRANIQFAERFPPFLKSL